MADKDGTRWSYAAGLDEMCSPGCYLLQLRHNCPGTTLPLPACDEEHYITATLIITESGTDDQLQRNRMIGQTLIMPDCNDGRTRIFNRTLKKGNSNRTWNNWNNTAQSSMDDEITSTEDLIASVTELKSQTKEIKTDLSSEAARSKEAEAAITKDAILSGSLNVDQDTDSVTLAYRNIDGTKVSEVDISAATTDKAGVMSAEDKEKLDELGIEVESFIGKTQSFEASSSSSANIDTNIHVENGLVYEITNNSDKYVVVFVIGNQDVSYSVEIGETKKCTFETSGYLRLYSANLSSSNKISVTVESIGKYEIDLENTRKQVESVSNSVARINTEIEKNAIKLPAEFPVLPFSIYKGFDGTYKHTKVLINKDNADIELYVDSETGASHNNGLSPNSPLASLSGAISKIQKGQTAIVYIMDKNPIRGTSIADSYNIDGIKILVTPYSDNRAIFSRRIPQDLYPVWESYLNNVYKCTTSLTVAGVVDCNRVDNNGCIIPLVPVSSVDECINAENTYFQTGNDVYVHSKKMPNNTDVFINFKNNTGVTFNVISGGSIQFDNVEFITQDDDRAILNIEGDNTGWVVLTKCKLSGGSYLRTQNRDLGCFRVYKCNSLCDNVVCGYNNADGFQYFVCDHCVELNCKAYYCGIIGVEGVSKRWSMNATTTHNYCNMIRCGFEAHHCSSPIIADVGVPKSILIEVHAKDCIYQNESERYAFLFYGGSEANSERGSVWLKDCAASGSISKGLIVGNTGEGEVSARTFNFNTYKEIEVRSGDIDVW